MFGELLTLFFIFFRIGLFTFGGGYAMIPLIQAEMVDGGYIGYDMMVDFIGISESTPGPLAINMATFVGFEQFGLLGAIVTTIGVALPSFLIILAIASLGSKALESIWTKRAFLGLKPVVIGLIIAVSIKLAFHAFLPAVDFDSFVFSNTGFSLKNLIILVIVGSMALTLKKMSPVKIILASALLGIIIHGLF